MEFWEQMGNELNNQIEEIKKSLAYGNVSSYDEYRQAVGTIQGLEWSKDCLKDIINNRFKLEED